MKILVGMSGGLDSNYAAHKLIEDGNDVEGAVVLMHEHTDITGAEQAAQALGIKLHIIDARELFESVKENFVREYSLGRTPNPCIVCNPTVKFRALVDYARMNGFDKIATGHYARVERAEEGERVHYVLKKSIDSHKDQTYMLYRLPEDILSMLVLPMGTQIKADVRKKAEEIGLLTANKPDSQEICFIPDGDYASYIEKKIGVFPEGDFVLDDGRVIGRHKGIIHYTIGQRKGLGVPYGERIFVSKIKTDSNEIVLSTEGNFTDTVILSDIVCTGIGTVCEGDTLSAEAKIRYLAKPTSCSVHFLGEGRAELKFDSPQRAVTPGQSAVVYDGDKLLFGGFIC